MGELARNESINIARPNIGQDMFEMMEKAYRFSEIMAKSDIIPTHYRDKPANVFVAMQTAYRMNLDPMLVMQNTFVVSGKLGMNSSFAIALANSSGIFVSGIKYKVIGEGDKLEVTAYAILKSNNEEISYTIGMREAIAENWTKNPKYKSLPELMLRYRAATLLIRTHVPEVINGMHMVEEIEDVTLSKEVRATKPTAISKLDEFLEAEEAKTFPIEGAYEELAALIEAYQIPQETIEKWCEKGGVESLKELSRKKTQTCIRYIKDKMALIKLN